MSDVESEGTAKQAEDRVWSDFTFEIVTDREEEHRRIMEIDAEINRLAEG
jgi:hypothetical protein